MNIFIMLAILIANMVAIALIYQFVKRLPKMEKIIFIAISFAINYMLVSITYWISGFGIENKINEIAKEFITFVFVPVNVIILVPFIAAKYSKFRFNEISKDELIKRIVLVGITGVIILTVECLYFKNMKSNIKVVNEDKQKKSINGQSIENEVTAINNIQEYIVNEQTTSIY